MLHNRWICPSNDLAAASDCHYYTFLCLWLCTIEMWMCVVEHEDRLDHLLSPGDCVDPASRGQAAITTSWALSGRWPTRYSTRAATLTERQTDRRAGSTTHSKTDGQKDKRQSLWRSDLSTESKNATNGWKQGKAVGVIGGQESMVLFKG